MSVFESGQVDAIGVDSITEEVVLTTTDHLTWEDEESHLLLLRRKLDTYIAFVESGELEDSYPDAKERKVRVDVYFKETMPAGARRFFSAAVSTFRSAGVSLRERGVGDWRPS